MTINDDDRIRIIRDDLREERERKRQLAQAFTPVDALPKRKSGRTTRPVPEVRLAMLDYCRQHPGQWVRYNPDADLDKAKPHTLSMYARKQHGGFGPGFQATVREKVAYIRYVGTTDAHGGGR